MLIKAFLCQLLLSKYMAAVNKTRLDLTVGFHNKT